MTEPTTPRGNPPAPLSRYKVELRRALRARAGEPEVNFLNITAMLDIMTIILVFLLKTLGESSAAVPQNQDLRLPRSIVRSQPSQEGVVVTISKSQLLLGDDKLLELPSRKEMEQTGVGASEKQNGPKDLYVTRLGTALSAARRLDRKVREAKGLDARSSEAIVIADGSTPYRVLIEVLFTLGQNEFGRYHLMVMQGREIP